MWATSWPPRPFVATPRGPAAAMATRVYTQREREREVRRGTKRRGAAMKGCGGQEVARLQDSGGFLSLDPFIWPTLLPASPGHTVHVEKQIERERGRVAHQ